MVEGVEYVHANSDFNGFRFISTMQWDKVQSNSLCEVDVCISPGARNVGDRVSAHTDQARNWA